MTINQVRQFAKYVVVASASSTITALVALRAMNKAENTVPASWTNHN